MIFKTTINIFIHKLLKLQVQSNELISNLWKAYLPSVNKRILHKISMGHDNIPLMINKIQSSLKLGDCLLKTGVILFITAILTLFWLFTGGNFYQPSALLKTVIITKCFNRNGYSIISIRQNTEGNESLMCR